MLQCHTVSARQCMADDTGCDEAAPIREGRAWKRVVPQVFVSSKNSLIAADVVIQTKTELVLIRSFVCGAHIIISRRFLSVDENIWERVSVQNGFYGRVPAIRSYRVVQKLIPGVCTVDQPCCRWIIDRCTENPAPLE